MLNEKLLEVLAHKADGAVAIVSQSETETHIVNTWNSYINITKDDKLLIPVGGFKKTERIVEVNNKLKLSICNREVHGFNFKGTGFVVEGTGKFIKSGNDFDLMKQKFDWIRAVLVITINSIQQKL